MLSGDKWTKAGTKLSASRVEPSPNASGKAAETSEPNTSSSTASASAVQMTSGTLMTA